MITKEFFGTLPDGREATLYTLTNANGLSASVTDLGAAWVRLLAPDRNGETADVLLGYDNAADYLHNGPHLGVIVGRVANRTGDACFTVDGKRYELAKNDGENNLHSGPDYYETRLWDADILTDAENTVAFSLVSPDGDQGYPGNLKIRVVYRLSDSNMLEIGFEASCDRKTPLNLINHAYFNLAGHAAGPVLSQEARIHADYYTVPDAHSIPTGEVRPVASTPLDFTDWHAIGERIDADYAALEDACGYDQNWCLSHPRGEFALAAEARDPESGRVLKVYTDLPGMQFYTANFLGGETGKGGVTYERRGAFCFETQQFPDAVNKPHFPSPILIPGQIFTSKTGYRFLTDRTED